MPSNRNKNRPLALRVLRRARARHADYYAEFGVAHIAMLGVEYALQDMQVERGSELWEAVMKAVAKFPRPSAARRMANAESESQQPINNAQFGSNL